MKFLKFSIKITSLIFLITILSNDLNAQLEVDANGTGVEFDIGRDGISEIELRPSTGNFDGSIINMYQAGDGAASTKQKNIVLDAGVNNSYGRLSLQAHTQMMPFGNANNTGIPSAGHPYSMLRLTNTPVTQTSGQSFAWSIGLYNNMDFGGSAGPVGSTSDDCVNCLTMAFESGGQGAMYQFSFSETGNFQTASDVRLKEDIVNISSSLDKLLTLSPKNYHYIWSEKNPKRKSTGFLAQDVKKVFPELVSSILQPNGEKTLMLDYIGLIPHITKGMQEQQEIIERQNELIEALSVRLSALEEEK